VSAPWLLLALLGAEPDGATEAFLRAEVVEVAAVKVAPQGPDDPAWARATPRQFAISAQRSVHLNDARANAALPHPGAERLTVRGAASETELALLLEWSDPSREALRTDEVNAFADSVAFEMPVRFGPGERLPYVGMGDAQAPVVVTMQRATAEGSQLNLFVAAGFGSLTRATGAPPVKASMVYDGVTHRWRAVFVRPLDAEGHSLQAGLVPVAFAVWDGGRGERGGYKQLSGWHYLRMPGRALDPAAVEAAAFGYHPGDLGDPARGKALVETVCIACHQLPGKRYAPVGAAPDLSDVGAIATASYLRDSVAQPSLVVVPNLQLNNHYSRTAPPDAWGAYPNAPAYAWGNRPDGGAVVSKMTVFSTFSPEQVADIVAFLKTLDGTTP